MRRTHITKAFACLLLALPFMASTNATATDYRDKTSPEMVKACGKNFIRKSLPRTSIGYPIQNGQIDTERNLFVFPIPGNGKRLAVGAPPTDDDFTTFGFNMALSQNKLFVVFMPSQHKSGTDFVIDLRIYGPNPAVYANGVPMEDDDPACIEYIDTTTILKTPKDLYPKAVQNMLDAQ